MASDTVKHPNDGSRDGRFLINTAPEATSASSINTVLNWQARLKK